MRPPAIVRVMLTKVLAPFLDEGSFPSRSTRGAGDLVLATGRSFLQDLLIGACSADGSDVVSTGSVVGTGDIRKAISVTKQTIIAAPKAMAAAA